MSQPEVSWTERDFLGAIMLMGFLLPCLAYRSFMPLATARSIAAQAWTPYVFMIFGLIVTVTLLVLMFRQRRLSKRD